MSTQRKGRVLINLDEGLILIGPGSEWFWTAFQGVVVAISLWALFRQLRLQTAQKMRDDVATLRAEYFSERMLVDFAPGIAAVCTDFRFCVLPCGCMRVAQSR